MIEINSREPNGPTKVRCPHCEVGGAVYLASDGGVRCDSCPTEEQPYDHTPIFVTVEVKI